MQTKSVHESTWFKNFFFNLDAKYYVTMNIKYIRHLKENLPRGILHLNKILYMKQLVTVKCHVSIYILEKGVVKFKPLERQEVFDTML